MICCKNCPKFYQIHYSCTDSPWYEFWGESWGNTVFFNVFPNLVYLYSFWPARITSLCPRWIYNIKKTTQYSLPVQACSPYKSSHVSVLINGLKLQCAQFVWFLWKTYILKSSALGTLQKAPDHPFPRLLFTMDSYLILQSKVKLFPVLLHL